MTNKLLLKQPNPFITEIKKVFENEIYLLEKKNNLPYRTLFLQLGLHIYKYSLDELFSCNQFDIDKIKQYSINSNLIYSELFALINYLKKDIPTYIELFKKCKPYGIDSKIVAKNGLYREISETTFLANINFGKVSSIMGTLIQEKIHYIKSRRKDTKFEFGLYRNNESVPFAYAAFSLVDRKYLLNLPCLKSIPSDRIFVMTRAYSFPNSPYNTMSTLYSKCFNYLKIYDNAAYVLTALNQNLFFTGSSLKSANFEIIAYSPMKYYYADGIYSTRRKLINKKEYFSQKFNPGPIMWFGNNLIATDKSSCRKPSMVSEEMYDFY